MFCGLKRKIAHRKTLYGVITPGQHLCRSLPNGTKPLPEPMMIKSLVMSCGICLRAVLQKHINTWFEFENEQSAIPAAHHRVHWIIRSTSSLSNKIVFFFSFHGISDQCVQQLPLIKFTDFSLTIFCVFPDHESHWIHNTDLLGYHNCWGIT